MRRKRKYIDFYLNGEKKLLIFKLKIIILQRIKKIEEKHLINGFKNDILYSFSRN